VHPWKEERAFTLNLLRGFCNQCLSPLVSSNPVHGEVYYTQHYVIKFVSDLPTLGFICYRWFIEKFWIWQDVYGINDSRWSQALASHWQTLLHNVVYSTPRHERDSNSLVVPLYLYSVSPMKQPFTDRYCRSIWMQCSHSEQTSRCSYSTNKTSSSHQNVSCSHHDIAKTNC
jgi:hypothetical protein